VDTKISERMVKYHHRRASMANVRKQYAREFKMEVVELLKASGKSAAQLKRELGIGHATLWRWKQQFAEDGEDAFPGQVV
jgi:transposase